MKRVDLFLPRFSQYQALHHFTRKMEEAFQSCGMKTRLLSLCPNGLEDSSGKQVDLFQDPPDFLFSFNAQFSSKQEGRANLITIPYFSLFVDSAHYFTPLVNDSNLIAGFVDRSGVDFFHEQKNSQVLFVPHGVEDSLIREPPLLKQYDVVFLATLTDYELFRLKWKKNLPPEQGQVMDNAVQLAFQNPSIPYYRLVLQSIKELGVDLGKIPFRECVTGVEVYLRGKERIDLLRSISKVDVHLFGAGGELLNKYLAEKRNIIAHPAVSYEESLHIMRRSRVVLHICSWIKYGGHERVFAAPACRALLIAQPNPYLQTHFKQGESILYFSPQFQDIDEMLQEYLGRQQKREVLVEKAREIVTHSHTWEVRARQILREIPALITPR